MGLITANGGAAGVYAGGAAAGGGSGGAIRLVANTISGAGSLLANGGSSAVGGGGPGRVRLEAFAIPFAGSIQGSQGTSVPNMLLVRPQDHHLHASSASAEPRLIRTRNVPRFDDQHHGSARRGNRDSQHPHIRHDFIDCAWGSWHAGHRRDRTAIEQLQFGECVHDHGAGCLSIRRLSRSHQGDVDTVARIWLSETWRASHDHRAFLIGPQRLLHYCGDSRGLGSAAGSEPQAAGPCEVASGEANAPTGPDRRSPRDPVRSAKLTTPRCTLSPNSHASGETRCYLVLLTDRCE